MPFTLTDPSAHVIYAFDAVIVSDHPDTHYYWATEPWQENGVISGGFRNWEGRVLSIGPIDRALGSQRQFSKATIALRLANTDGGLTSLFTSLNHLKLEISAYCVTFNPNL